eukprot:COSAG06_NODE_8964_length_2022_cov_449.856994_2_plen_118_part_00
MLHLLCAIMCTRGHTHIACKSTQYEATSIHVCVCACVCVCATVYLFIRIIFIYLFIYMHTQGALPPMMLTVGNVHDIHHDGGTVLGSSRGGFDSDIIQAKLKEWYTGIDLSLFSAFS